MNIQITHGHTFPSLFTGYFYYTSSSSQSPNNSPISNLSRNSSNSLLLFSLTDLGSTVQEVNQEEEGLKMIVNVLQASLEEKKSLLRVLYSGAVLKFQHEIDDSPYAISTSITVPLPPSPSTSSSSDSSTFKFFDDVEEQGNSEMNDSQATIKFNDLITTEERRFEKKRKVLRVNSLHILPGVLSSENGVKILDENHIIATRFRELIEERIWSFEKPK